MSAEAQLSFCGLAGELPVRAPRRTSSADCRRLLAGHLDLEPEQVHLHPLAEEAVDGFVSVVICGTYRLTCRDCGHKMECSCHLPADACECVLAQECQQEAPADEDALCQACLRNDRMRHHRPCGSALCQVCAAPPPAVPARRRHVAPRRVVGQPPGQQRGAFAAADGEDPF